MQLAAIRCSAVADGHANKVALAGAEHVFRAQQYLAREGETPGHLQCLMTGWAIRYKLLVDGRRQITAVYLPGDLCEPGWIHCPGIAQSVVAVTPVLAVAIDRRALEDEAGLSAWLPQLWNDAVAQADQQSEWLVNLGRKSALERLAHFFCEIHVRLRLVGQSRDDSCDFPLTQLDLADINGLTPVHVNRTLQEMRQAGLIMLEARRLTIPSFAKLADVGMFNDDYLAALSRQRCRDLVTLS